MRKIWPFTLGGSFITEKTEDMIALNFIGHAQAIGVGLAVLLIFPFDSFMRSPRMSQMDPTCESYGRFHQVAYSIGKVGRRDLH